MTGALHLAFLRGVGGAVRKTPGDELRRCFSAAGYGGVSPVLATGNVIFALAPGMKAPRPSDIERMLEKHFGFAITVILRGEAEIAKMFAADPFRRIDPARQGRFVCMLGEGATRPAAEPKPPQDADFRVVGQADANVYLVRDRALEGTPGMTTFLERTFGRAITTRNWNTMEKVAARLR